MHGAEIHRTENSLVDRCLSIDLEVDPGKAQIFGFAAVRRTDQKKVIFRNGNREAALDRLEDLASEAEFLLGHNIIRFDLPHLAAVRPRLAELATKAIDTLWLNPLAFPRNPYHHLVKHHHEAHDDLPADGERVSRRFRAAVHCRILQGYRSVDGCRGNLREFLNGDVNLGLVPARVHALLVLGEAAAALFEFVGVVGHAADRSRRNPRHVLPVE